MGYKGRGHGTRKYKMVMNGRTDERANGRKEGVTLSLLELLITANKAGVSKINLSISKVLPNFGFCSHS